MRTTLRAGFTIIELLIVMVVIGILVALSVVAYVGIQQQAVDKSILNDLENVATEMTRYQVRHNGAFGTDGTGSAVTWYSEGPDNTNIQITPSPGNIIDTVANNSDFCIRIYNPGSGQYKSLLTAAKRGSTTTACAGLGPSAAAVSGDSGGYFDQPGSCPTGFIPVPGIEALGTEGGFCVMKYEAKNVGGVATSQAGDTPWVSISLPDAASAATAACSSCHLITEAEWMTVAANVLSVSSNWSSGTVGTGYIYQGHVNNNPTGTLAASTNDSDTTYGITGGTGGAGLNNRRTLTLTNGEVIWDFSGNVWEWTESQTMSNVGVPGDSTFVWRDWSNGSLSLGNLPSVSAPSGLASLPNLSSITSWTSSHGIGQIFANYAYASPRALARGGGWGSTTTAGVLSLYINNSPTGAYTNDGFRVAK